MYTCAIGKIFDISVPQGQCSVESNKAVSNTGRSYPSPNVDHLMYA